MTKKVTIRRMSADQLRTLLDKRARSTVRMNEIITNQDEVISYLIKVIKQISE